jgi:hypothetical protein
MLTNHEQAREKCIVEHLDEQTRKHNEELNAMKRSQMETNNLFTSYNMVEHCKSVTKASDILFDGQTKNWPVFEDHLVKEAENPTIGWNKDIIGFQIMGQCPVINLLETYFDLPPNIITRLQGDLKDTKQEDLSNMDTKYYKLNAIKTKLRNCQTASFGDHIE